MSKIVKIALLSTMIIFSFAACMSLATDLKEAEQIIDNYEPEQNIYTNIADDALKIVENNKCVDIEYSLDGWYASGYEVYDLEIYDSEFDGYKDYTYIFADGSKIRLNVKEIDNSVNYADVVK